MAAIGDYVVVAKVNGSGEPTKFDTIPPTTILAQGVQFYSSGVLRGEIVTVSGDLWFLSNAYWDITAKEFYRIDQTKAAFGYQLQGQGFIPGEPDLGFYVAGATLWVAAPAAYNLIRNGGSALNDRFAGVGGWELGSTTTQERNFTIGGMGIELDGSGTFPFGRVVHNTTGSILSRRASGNVWNAYADMSSADDVTKPGFFAGFVQHDVGLVWVKPTHFEISKIDYDAIDSLPYAWTPFLRIDLSTGEILSPTLVTPVLGTPSSGTLTNCTGLPNASVVGLGTAALVADNTLVHLAGTETIAGTKAFTASNTIFGNAANNSGAIIAKGGGKAVRMGGSSTQASIEGVDETGFASFQPLLVRGKTLALDTTDAVPVVVNAGNSAGLTVNGPLNASGRITATPSTSNSTLATGAIEIQSYAVDNAWLGHNVYFDGSGFKRRADGHANWVYFSAGDLVIFADATGSAGVGASPNERARFHNAGGMAVTGAITSTTTVTAAKAILVDDVHQLTAVTSGSESRTLDLANGTLQQITANQTFSLTRAGPALKSGPMVLYIYNNTGSSFNVNGAQCSAGRTHAHHYYWDGRQGTLTVNVDVGSGDRLPLTP